MEVFIRKLQSSSCGTHPLDILVLQLLLPLLNDLASLQDALVLLACRLAVALHDQGLQVIAFGLQQVVNYGITYTFQVTYSPVPAYSYHPKWDVIKSKNSYVSSGIPYATPTPSGSYM